MLAFYSTTCKKKTFAKFSPVLFYLWSVPENYLFYELSKSSCIQVPSFQDNLQVWQLKHFSFFARIDLNILYKMHNAAQSFVSFIHIHN